MAQWYDLSVTISPDLPVWSAFDPPRIEPIQRIAQGDISNVSGFTMATHVSSHVDAPLHCFDDTTSVDELPLDLLIGGAYVVDMTGVDLAAVADFEARDIPEETERLINECLRKKIGIILDFSELSYISSVGIGTLVRAYKIAKKDGLKIVIVRPPEPVMGIIRTVEIDRLHLIASTREEAEKIIKETAE